MEAKEFGEKMRRAVAEILGEDYQVTLQEVRKNNGVVLLGLVILAEGQNVSPTIYLSPFLAAYEDGVSLSELVRNLLEIYRNDRMQKKMDLSFFRDFSRVRERVCYRLIHAGKNRELLKKIPHVPFLDLAICFYYAYEDNCIGSGSILVYNTHMEMWQTDTAELMGLAQNNTPRLFPWQWESMEKLMMSRMPETGWECSPVTYMDVVTNKGKMHGAASVLYPGVLKQMGKRYGSDFYIIPSSLHEVILLPCYNAINPGELKQLIKEVNRFQLEPEDILSDNLYYYNRKEENVKIV